MWLARRALHGPVRPGYLHRYLYVQGHVIMTRGVRELSVGYPFRYPLRGVIYPLGLNLKILLIDTNVGTKVGTCETYPAAQRRPRGRTCSTLS